MTRRTMKCHYACPIEAAMDVLGGKWKSLILYHLKDGTKRFNELGRLMPSISQRMLTRQLRELENDQLITREVFPVVPPRVDYDLTKLGESLVPILRQLRDWGAKHQATIVKIKEEAEQ